jgi:hypothetical protein
MPHLSPERSMSGLRTDSFYEAKPPRVVIEQEAKIGCFYFISFKIISVEEVPFQQ